MHVLNNDFGRPHKKSARIVGDVIGKYIPMETAGLRNNCKNGAMVVSKIPAC